MVNTNVCGCGILRKKKKQIPGGSCVKQLTVWKKRTKWMICAAVCSAVMAAGSAAMAADMPHEQTIPDRCLYH